MIIILNYIEAAVLQTGWQLLLVLGPMLAIGFALHILSRYIRTRSAGVMGLNGYTYLTAPGVMVHELGHAFFCVIFFHKIVKMQLFSPKPDGTLGQVQHSFNPRSIYQKIGNFFIGTGPLWFGTAVIYLLSQFLINPIAGPSTSSNLASGSVFSFATIVPQVFDAAWQLLASLFHQRMFSSWRFWVFVYLVFCIGSHTTLSPPDIAGAWSGFVSLVAFMLIVNLLTLWMDRGSSAWACEQLVRACVNVYAVCVFVISLNLALAATAFVLSLVKR